MRFAISAVDRYLGIFESFVKAGWQPLKLFTHPLRDAVFANQQAVIAYAEQNKAAIQLSPITEQDLQDLHSQGCDILIVASYDHKIPEWSTFLRYAINFHASPLPHGRGAYPVARAILDGWDHWGVTCHKLTAAFDEGDILKTVRFPLEADECHESLDLKIQMAAKTLAAYVAYQFAPLWEQAQPQENGSYWPKTKMMDRVIDFQNRLQIFCTISVHLVERAVLPASIIPG